MARIRTIKPDMATSMSLSDIPREVLYTWAQLWPQCDDHGRYFGDPRLVWAAIYPLRDDVNAIALAAELQMLADHGKVCCYRACDGRVYLHVPSWEEHQRVDRPAKSRIPPCRLHEPDAECVRHGDERCDSTPAHFVEAEALSSDDLANDSRESREGLASNSRVTREDSTTGPRTVDRGPRTTDSATRSRETATGDVVPIESEGQRVNRLTKHYTDRVPLANFPAVAGVVRKAVRSQRYTDAQLSEALDRLGEEGRSVTADSLRYELEGFASRASPRGPTRSTTDDRVAAGLDLARRLAQEGR